jgi:hypothetical protein
VFDLIIVVFIFARFSAAPLLDESVTENIYVFADKDCDPYVTDPLWRAPHDIVP